MTRSSNNAIRNTTKPRYGNFKKSNSFGTSDRSTQKKHLSRSQRQIQKNPINNDNNISVQKTNKKYLAALLQTATFNKTLFFS